MDNKPLKRFRAATKNANNGVRRQSAMHQDDPERQVSLKDKTYWNTIPQYQVPKRNRHN